MSNQHRRPGAHLAAAASVAVILGASTPAAAEIVIEEHFELPPAGTVSNIEPLCADPPFSADFVPSLIAGLPPAPNVPPTGSFLRLATAGDAADPLNPKTINCGFLAFTTPTKLQGAPDVVIDFDLRMTPGFNKADGMGFALLNAAKYDPAKLPTTQAALAANGAFTTSFEEPNFAASVGVGFDIYPSPNDASGNSVSVHYDGHVRLDVDVTGAVNDLAQGGERFFHARILLRQRSKDITVTLAAPGGPATTVVDRFVIDDLAPYSGHAFFGARSGYSSADHDLDNVVVQVNDPEVEGRWSGAQRLPSVPIHAHLLPTGDVMFWDRHDFPLGGDPHLWTPATQGVSPAATLAYDVFCSGHALLPDGRLLVAGGHLGNNVGSQSASLYDPVAGAWTPLPPMSRGRWYPTVTVLANGDALVASGEVDKFLGENTIPEVYRSSIGAWRALDVEKVALKNYPFLYQAPNGKVFYAGPLPDTRYLDLAFDPMAVDPYQKAAWEGVLAKMQYGEVRDYGTSVMYESGKILNAGGGGEVPGGEPTATAETIDLGGATPAWEMTSPMGYERRQLTGTLLADGAVLVTGGTSCGGDLSKTDCPKGAVLTAEIWDPATSPDPSKVVWTSVARMQVPRVYHSTALLLPDGRVFVAGGGHPGSPDDHPDAEIFSPPYLFRGPRPVITSAPARIAYGVAFDVETPEPAVAGVHLVRLSSVTHAFNQNQRLCRLDFMPKGGHLAITAPAKPETCPPGDYMLFVLGAGRIPSEARLVNLRAESAPVAKDDGGAPYEVQEDGLLVVSAADGVLKNDSGEGPLAAKIESAPAHGKASLGADGSLVYQPEPDFQGPTDSFVYRALGETGSSTATVTIAITAVDDPPRALDGGSLIVVDGAPATGSLRATDVDSAALAIRLVKQGSQGIATVVDAATGRYVYVPKPGATGTDELAFQANDGHADSNAATVTVTFVTGRAGCACRLASPRDGEGGGLPASLLGIGLAAQILRRSRRRPRSRCREARPSG